MSIDLNIYVKHCNLSKELWIVLNSFTVILLHEILANLFLNLLLSIDIVWISILESCKPLILLLLLLNLVFSSRSNDSLDLDLLISFQSLEEIRICTFQSKFEIGISQEHLL